MTPEQVAAAVAARAHGEGQRRLAAAEGGVGRSVDEVTKRIEEHVRTACLLAAPTGCASYLLKFGASTLHRAFGIPVGYCGAWKDRATERFRRMKTRLSEARLFVIDEMSMVGRQMLGKIEFKV